MRLVLAVNPLTYWGIEYNGGKTFSWSSTEFEPITISFKKIQILSNP